MRFAPRSRILLGLLVISVGLTGFAWTDQTYAFYVVSVSEAPAGEHVYRYSELTPADKEFLETVGLDDGGIGGHALTLTFSEWEGPRDMFDLYANPDTLRTPGSYAQYRGQLYQIHGDAFPAIEPLLVVLKLLIVFIGLVIVGGGVLKWNSHRPRTELIGVVSGAVTFLLVEWHVPDVGLHLLPVVAAVAVSAAIFETANYRASQ